MTIQGVNIKEKMDAFKKRNGKAFAQNDVPIELCDCVMMACIQTHQINIVRKMLLQRILVLKYEI